MAEWSGPRHRRRGTPEALAADEHSPDVPEAPGAVASPQLPGQVPDRSSIAGQFSTRVTPSPNPRRPLTEYQTAQRIMGVFRAEPGKEREPARFEQATASFEEIRKADPAQWPPGRPVAGNDALDSSESLPLVGEGDKGSQINP